MAADGSLTKHQSVILDVLSRLVQYIIGIGTVISQRGASSGYIIKRGRQKKRERYKERDHIKKAC